MKKRSKKSRANGAQNEQSHLTLVGYVRRNLRRFVSERNASPASGGASRASLGNHPPRE
jgi:hypothetical protein